MTGFFVLAALLFGGLSAQAPAASHVPVSCESQLHAISAAERGDVGASGLDAAGLPELARAARAATTLAGARQYGTALEAESNSLHGCQAQAPAWLYVGPVKGGCVVVSGGNGDTSALVCSDGTAETS